MADDVDWNAAPEHQVDRQFMLEADEKNRNPQPFWFLPSLAHVRHSIKSLCRSEPEHKVGREVVLEAVTLIERAQADREIVLEKVDRKALRDAARTRAHAEAIEADRLAVVSRAEAAEAERLADAKEDRRLQKLRAERLAAKARVVEQAVEAERLATQATQHKADRVMKAWRSMDKRKRERKR